MPPSSPNTIFNSSARPPRTLQWSIGLQREIRRDFVVEATYVGNRGVWWSAEGLDQYQCNCLSDQTLAHYGISRNNPASLALLTDLISSPQAIQAGFGPAYPGMPPNDTVAQQIRPVPQWASGGPSSFLGPPMGKTWYDGLQTKATKRFSHGLSGQASFVWSKATDIGAGSEAPIFLTYNPVIQDIFNYGNNKQLNQLSPPLALVISGNYTTPKTPGDSLGAHVRFPGGARLAARLAAALPERRSDSDRVIRQSAREPIATAGWFQRSSVRRGQPCSRCESAVAVNPNCGCFNPQTAIVLNTAAWSDPGSGQWGSFRSVLQQLPLAKAAGGVDEFRPELPDGQGRQIQLFKSAPNSRTSSTACSCRLPQSALLPRPLPLLVA